ncbi:MAG: monovalent cation/H+ antiporter subunit D family protein [Syntrophobacteraceae bacterium]
MPIFFSLAPALAVLGPLAAIPGILSARSQNIRETWTLGVSLLVPAIVAAMAPGVLGGATYSLVFAEVLPGAPIALRVDALGMLFALVASFLWIVTSVYSIGYMRSLEEHAQARFYTFFAVSIFCAVGVAFSANLLTMYLFYELLSFSTYPLVAHHQDEAGRKAGRRYLGFIVGSSIGLVLPAMVVTHHLAGDLDFARAGTALAGIPAGSQAVLLGLFIFGFAKAAIMPVHAWLPSAMVAPTPVSSLLHAVAVVKVGAFCILRVITGIFGTDSLLQFNLNDFITGAAAVTVVIASLTAMSQDELKRRLAFSTIGQLSYIILGAGLLNAAGLTGSILHIAMHAFGKITLFFCAGAIYVATGLKRISHMQGIGRRMPVTMGAFFLGSLSIIGIPPTGGFISKWYLLNGCIDSGSRLLVGTLFLSSLLNAAYFLPIVYRAWFPSPEARQYSGPIAEAPLACLVPLVLTAAISVGLFFFPGVFIDLARMAVK